MNPIEESIYQYINNIIEISEEQEPLLIQYCRMFSAVITGSFYVLDISKKRFIYIKPDDLLLCGYSVKEAMKLNFDLFPLIIHPEDLSLWNNFLEIIPQHLQALHEKRNEIDHISCTVRLIRKNSYTKDPLSQVLYQRMIPVWKNEKISYLICSVESVAYKKNGFYLHFFDDIFHSRKISEKEFQKEGSDVLPIVSNRLIPFNESKKFLKHYSLNLYLSNTLYLLYDLIDSFPTGTCLPFQTRIFLNTHNNLLPCEKVSYKNFLGKVNDHVFINIPEIVQRYNSYYVHCKKVCQYCYGGRACSTCLLSLDNLDQLGVEEFVCPDFQNQKTFEDKLNRIFSYLEKCPSEFFQIINHLITE